jgi:hypothetical protein
VIFHNLLEFGDKLNLKLNHTPSAVRVGPRDCISCAADTNNGSCEVKLKLSPKLKPPDASSLTSSATDRRCWFNSSRLLQFPRAAFDQWQVADLQI